MAGQLSMAVPAAIPGDPTTGMGRLAWNILLRNTGRVSCALTGWPGLAAATGAGPVGITTARVAFSNLAQVRPRRFGLAAGQQAVVTVQAADSTDGCLARWELTLRLPGRAGSLSATQPARFFGPCGGGLLRVSPFYPRSALARAIRHLGTGQSPSPFRTASGQAPGACTARRMHLAASYGAAGRGGSVTVLRLVTSGGACALADSGRPSRCTPGPARPRSPRP